MAANRVGRAVLERLRIRLIPTAATRTAVGLLEEDLLDVTLSGYPAVVRLEG